MHDNKRQKTTIQYHSNKGCVSIIDQTLLPHRFACQELYDLADFCHAIASMQVRGAPLIGITAAFGLALAIAKHEQSIEQCYAALLATRPTAINLKWALDQVLAAANNSNSPAQAALNKAQQLRSQDVSICHAIGKNGLTAIQTIYEAKKSTVNILTHCNAGWLATVQWGTALAPIYLAQQANIPIHVWVDETRPRNQGASLTAWELAQAGINHTIICDNTGGHLMQQEQVDLCIVGSDRTAANGDVCNKIGTYLKALAAFDNQIPFYVALPTSTIDWSINNGVADIPIEQRACNEVLFIQGLNSQGEISQVKIANDSPAANYAFDVTPARLVTALITEHGIYNATTQSLNELRNTND